MESILITGGAGFIGSNLAAALLGAGAEVTVLDNLSRRGSERLLETVRGLGATFVRGDVRDPEAFERLRGDFTLLVECSAEPSVLAGTRGDGARFLVENNLGGALHGFEWARARRTPVLFLSTSRVYPYDRINALPFAETGTRFVPTGAGPGVGPDGLGRDFPLEGVRSLYGATKLAAELVLREYARQFDLPALILRCGVVAGPGQLARADQGIFTYWLAAHHFGRPLAYLGFGGQGKQVRDLLHVGDLAALLLQLAARIREFRGEVFHAGGSTFSNLSLCEATKICRALTGRSMEIGGEPAGRPADLRWLVMDNADTTATFDWRPRRPPERILADTLAWIRENESWLQPILAP